MVMLVVFSVKPFSFPLFVTVFEPVMETYLVAFVPFLQPSLNSFVLATVLATVFVTVLIIIPVLATVIEMTLQTFSTRFCDRFFVTVFFVLALAVKVHDPRRSRSQRLCAQHDPGGWLFFKETCLEAAILLVRVRVRVDCKKRRCCAHKTFGEPKRPLACPEDRRRAQKTGLLILICLVYHFRKLIFVSCFDIIVFFFFLV